MKEKNYVIELLRFLFCLHIINYHFFLHYELNVNIPRFFARSYLGDEFFFMICGFFLAEAAIRTNQKPFEFTLGQIKGRLRKIAFPYFFSWFFCFLGLHIALLVWTDYSLKEFFFNSIKMSIFELTFTRMFGFERGFYSNEVVWFFSALLIITLFLAPFAVKLKEKFTLIIAPIIAIIAYSMIGTYFNRLNAPFEYFGNSLLLKGLVRGCGAICLGCFINGIVRGEFFRESIKKSPRARNIIAVLDIVFMGAVIIYMFFPFATNTDYPTVGFDYLAIFFMMLALIPLLGGIFRVEKKWQIKLAKKLGKFSFYAFCGQGVFYSLDSIVYFRMNLSHGAKYVVMLLSITTFTLLLMFLDRPPVKKDQLLKDRA